METQKMVAPEGVCSIGFGGVALEANADGSFDVPFANVDEAKSHGFTPAPQGDALADAGIGQDEDPSEAVAGAPDLAPIDEDPPAEG